MPTPIKIQPNLSYSIEILGARPAGFSDIYHALLRMKWWSALLVIATVYLLVNVLFGAIYFGIGGIENARDRSFVDAFFFSVHTFGTIGYGNMYPSSPAANAVVVAESITGLIATALATGLIFVRFSLTKARMVFGKQVAIGPMDGVPTLMIRLGNDRANQIFDAHMRLTLSMTTTTKEGTRFYRSVDLPLVRDRAAALARSWNVLHRIDASSPLAGHTPASLKDADAEINISVSGVDDTSMQLIHARHLYEATSIAWGARLADVLSETPEGNLVLDLRRFHDLVPTEPIEAFPYRLSVTDPPEAPPA